MKKKKKNEFYLKFVSLFLRPIRTMCEWWKFTIEMNERTLLEIFITTSHLFSFVARHFTQAYKIQFM